mmetsp:Transcript_160097/g.513659  ORF Transcript_160097/g.513659 Transcript_160097/m.513659 type:complete len:713 (-) Transcript_160097:86-2224(-)
MPSGAGSLRSSPAPSINSTESIQPLRNPEDVLKRFNDRGGAQVTLDSLFAHNAPRSDAGGFDDEVIMDVDEELLAGFRYKGPRSVGSSRSGAMKSVGVSHSGLRNAGLRRQSADPKRLQWLLSKPPEWQRELLRHPWCLPVGAMHLAAITIQDAWHRSWLRATQPSKSRPQPLQTYRAIRDHAAVSAVAATAPPSRSLAPTAGQRRGSLGDHVGGGRKRRASVGAKISTGLRQRYFELLQREVEATALAAKGVGRFPARSYPSFEGFNAAIIQGRWRSRRRLQMVRRVQGYKQFKLYQVAAYEIQNAWRRYLSSPGGGYGRLVAVAKLARRANAAAAKIQRAWRGCNNYRVYQTLRDTIAGFKGIGDPCLLLRTVMPRESMLLDPSMQVHVRFRLGGRRFPPTIYFKVFTHGKICDVGAFAPRDYAGERLFGKGNAPEGWYERRENNGWRALATRLVPGKERYVDEVEKTTANKPIRNFHHSRIQRRQDVEKKRKARTIDWMRKMYGMDVDSAATSVVTPRDAHPTLFAPPPHAAKRSLVAAGRFAVGAPAGPGGIARRGASDRGMLAAQLTDAGRSSDGFASSQQQPLEPRPPGGPPPAGRPLRRPPSSGSSTFSSNAGLGGSSAASEASPRTPHAQQLAIVRAAAGGGAEPKGDDLEDSALLDWSSRLDFEAYIGNWQTAATSDFSEGTLPIREKLREPPGSRFGQGLVY